MNIITKNLNSKEKISGPQSLFYKQVSWFIDEKVEQQQECWEGGF